ncbi:MAG: MFS transporter [Defluviitaleaceae bacterium]|nr:MFS transporter [Defluviitaleaceae bacterium]
MEGNKITRSTNNPFRIIYEAAVSIKGNARACVLPEPLFSIPQTMYIGFMTLYMLELGVTLPQVGMITSLGLIVHIFFALSSPIITDKLGRKYTTLIFDTLGWGFALVVWAIAQNIYFFIIAAIINGFSRVVGNSWHCLMLEDSEPETRIHIFNFLHMANILGGFFSPIGALLINRMTLVPAMRAMLVFSLVSMMTLFILRHFLVTETAVGQQKMQEMKGVKIGSVLGAYMPVLKRIVKDKLLIVALFLRSLNFVQLTIRQTFLAVLVTQRLMFPAEAIALFHTLNAIVMLLVLLFITPILARFTRNWPISLGIGFHVAATAVLLLTPAQNYPLLILSAILIALGTGIATPRIDTLVANTIVNEERSVANAIMAVFILVLSVPFGYIGGVLSEIDTRLPFVMTLAIFLVCLATLYITKPREQEESL